MNSFIYRNRAAWIAKLLLILIAVTSLTSCATYNQIKLNPGYLNADNVLKINGTYYAESIPDSVRTYNCEWRLKQFNFLNEIDRKMMKDTLQLYSLSEYAFKLKVHSPKSITISYLENDTIIRERTLKTRISRFGYLQLKNKNIAVTGIPFLLGGYDQKRIRLSMDKNGNLLVDTASDRYGSLLVVFAFNRFNSERQLYALKPPI